MTPKQLLPILEAAELTIGTVTEDSVQVSVGRGLQVRKAELRMDQLPGDLPDDDLARRALLSSFARGVYAALGEPKRSLSREIAFVDAAKTVLPLVDSPAFIAGVAAVDGPRPFTRPLGDQLVVSYVIELDHGIRLLSEAHVKAWGVHPERVEKAAMSILFHRTRMGDLSSYKGLGVVDAFAVGDGMDASRIVILDSWDYPRCRKGAHFSMPSPDLLLVSRNTQEPGIESFRNLTRKAYAEAEQPLLPDVFSFEDGKTNFSSQP